MKTAGAKYSCEVKDGTSYNFYVLTTPKDDAETINLIMDRNICDDGTLAIAENKCSVAWISNEKYYEDVGGVIPDDLLNDDGMCQNGGICRFIDKGPLTAMDYLYDATKDWINVPNIEINYTDEGNIGNYGYGTIITTNGLTKITKKDLTTVTSSYKNLKARLPYKSEVSDYDSTNKTNAYLYDYLSQSGTIQTNTISGIYGYWTFSSDVDSLYAMIKVEYSGYVGSIPVYLDSGYGVRPVITLKM